jgi:hypothetical protein
VGTVVDLSSIQTYNGGFNDNSTAGRVQTVSASNSGSINFSSLTEVVAPSRSEDRIDFVLDATGTMDLTALQTISGGGQVKFSVNKALFELPALTNAQGLSFSMPAGSQLDLPELISQNRGSVSVPDSGTVNAPKLATLTNSSISISANGTLNAAALKTFTDSVLTLGATQTLNAPAFETIDDSQFHVSGGQTLAVADTEYIGTGTWSVTTFSADGVGTVVDLSSIQTYNGGFNDNSTAGRVQTVRAMNQAHIDLSSLASIIGPARGEDRIDFRAESGGSIDMTSLQNVTGGGQVRFNIGSQSSITVGDLTVTNSLSLTVSDVTSVFDVNGSLLLAPNADVTVGGGGGFSVAGNYAFETTSETALDLSGGFLTMDGAGVFNDRQSLEVGGDDLGLPGVDFGVPADQFDAFIMQSQNNGNFSIGELTIGQVGQSTYVELLDWHNNGNRSSFEATYLGGGGGNGLNILGGSTLVLNHIPTYAFIDGQWVFLNDEFTGGITQIALSTLTSDPAADGFIAIPEPASLALVGMGGLMMLHRRRRG